ncbi:hypothetical protein Hanom_Chr14g01320781 [Helianthus anomalus]
MFNQCVKQHSYLRLWGMGRELERNAQVTTPGGLGFGRGPLGGSFRPGVGRGYHMTWRNLIGQEH